MLVLAVDHVLHREAAHDFIKTTGGSVDFLTGISMVTTF